MMRVWSIIRAVLLALGVAAVVASLLPQPPGPMGFAEPAEMLLVAVVLLLMASVTQRPVRR